MHSHPASHGKVLRPHNKIDAYHPWNTNKSLRCQVWPVAAGANPGFCSMNRLEVFLLPLVKRYSIGTNRRVECTPTTIQPKATGNILNPHNEMHFTNGIPIVKCYSTGTKRTNGQVECTPTQPAANGNLSISYNGIPIDECYSKGTNSNPKPSNIF